MAKLGVSRKTALGKDYRPFLDFNQCLTRFLFLSLLLSSKEIMTSRVAKAILENKWLRDQEHGEPELR